MNLYQYEVILGSPWERRRIDGCVIAENLGVATLKVRDKFTECPDYEIIDLDIRPCSSDIYWYEVYDEYRDDI